MTVTTTYPGVYLSEEASLNFSVQNSTTVVPVFITNASQTGIPQAKSTRFGSWAEVQETIPDEHNNQYYYIALRFWFSQGGGRCYIMDYDNLKKNIIPEDATLIVANGNNKETVNTFTTFSKVGSPFFVLLDGPKDQITSDADASAIMTDYPVSPYAAAFYPFVTTEWASIPVPPSLIAAVAIAKTDRSRGVWKAPANVVIEGITPNYPVTDDLQGRFNQGKALNMIRTFPGTGTMLWGARTLDDSDNWRYIPVRRLFTMVERNIQRALNKLVFESNSQPTWQRVKVAVDNYLYALWKKGALVGNKANEAWFVEIGKDITMTDDDINQGKMIVKIGLAAVRPAEFIILQFSQNVAQ